MLPQIINRIVEAGVSITRVQSFLLCRDHEAPGPGCIEDEYGVQMKDATFIWESKKPKADFLLGASKQRSPAAVLAQGLHDARWEAALLKAQLAEADYRLRELIRGNEQASGPSIEEQHSPDSLLALKRINFECGRGQLIAVVGSVGSGKSSLVNSILGETHLVSGTEAVRGRLALFPQTPFIFNDTLQNNIIFGSDGVFDAKRYARAIQCTALGPDLDALPGRDQTEIGEKGSCKLPLFFSTAFSIILSCPLILFFCSVLSSALFLTCSSLRHYLERWSEGSYNLPLLCLLCFHHFVLSSHSALFRVPSQSVRLLCSFLCSNVFSLGTSSDGSCRL